MIRVRPELIGPGHRQTAFVQSDHGISGVLKQQLQKWLFHVSLATFPGIFSHRVNMIEKLCINVTPHIEFSSIKNQKEHLH